MNNNLLKVIIAILGVLVIVVVVKNFEKTNQIKELSNSLAVENQKEELNLKAQSFIEALYQGEHLEFYSKDALARFSSYEEDEEDHVEEEHPTDHDYKVDFHLAKTSHENKTYTSKVFFDVTDITNKGENYSQTTLLMTVEWIVENEKYKVSNYEIKLIDSLLNEFQSEY